MPAEDKDKDIVREFRGRRSRQLAAIAAVIFLLLSVIWKMKHPGMLFGQLSKPVVVFLEVCAIAAFVAYSAYNWRCPSCDRYLGSDISPAHCRSCKIPLR